VITRDLPQPANVRAIDRKNPLRGFNLGASQPVEPQDGLSEPASLFQGESAVNHVVSRFLARV
jgi:hypothetical protein